jgi:hypothetical protein
LIDFLRPLDWSTRGLKEEKGEGKGKGNEGDGGAGGSVVIEGGDG